MANNENLKPFVAGDDPRRNLDGRPEGSKNRATIAKQILEMVAIVPDDVFETLKSVYPDIAKKMTAEEVATIVMVGSAIKGDVNAYKAVMDSAYGAPKQEVNGNITNTPVMTLDPLNDTATNDSPSQNIGS